MTTELLVVRALERGFSFKDFEDLPIEFLLGCIIAHQNTTYREEEEETEEIIEAKQEDFDQW